MPSAKLLRQAGQSVAATSLLPAGAGIAALEAALAAARAAFDAERAALVSLRANARRAGATLAAITAELPNIRPLDAAPLALEPIRQQILACQSASKIAPLSASQNDPLMHDGSWPDAV